MSVNEETLSKDINPSLENNATEDSKEETIFEPVIEKVGKVIETHTTVLVEIALALQQAREELAYLALHIRKCDQKNIKYNSDLYFGLRLREAKYQEYILGLLQNK